MQRALLLWRRAESRATVIAALQRAGRPDLIGYGPDCLVRPERKRPAAPEKKENPAPPKKPAYQAGWAKPTPKKNARPGGKGGRKR